MLLHVTSVVGRTLGELFLEDLVGRLCCSGCDLGVCIEGSVGGAWRDQKLGLWSLSLHYVYVQRVRSFFQFLRVTLTRYINIFRHEAEVLCREVLCR